VICDNALVSGFAADERPIGAATVRGVCIDLDLPVPELPVPTVVMPDLQLREVPAERFRPGVPVDWRRFSFKLPFDSRQDF
jgi:hypothetical protein